MKRIDYSKWNFAELAMMFVIHVVLSLFIASVLQQYVFVEADVINIAAVVFIASLLLRVPQGVAADVTINDTTYAGEFYDIFVSKLVTGFETARKGLIMVKSGIKKKGTVGTIEVDSFIQAPQDPPLHGGNVSVGGRPLVPDEVMGYMVTDPKKFETHWSAVQMNPKLLDRELPVTFESAVVNRTIELNQKFMDLITWRGVRDNAAVTTALTTPLGPSDNNLIFTDGLVQVTKTAVAAGNKIVSPTAVVLTAANIKGKFDDMKALINAHADGAAAYNDPNFVWIVNYKTGSLYGDAVKAQTNKGDDFTKRGAREYDGKPIIEVFGQHDDTIWAGIATDDERSQIWMGVNEPDEDTLFRVAKLQANSEKIFIKMLTKFCFNIAEPTQVFIYTTK